MSDVAPVNTNLTLSTGDSYPPCVVEALRTGFLDSGIIVKVAIPYIANVRRKVPVGLDHFQNRSIPITDRQPLFGILVDPYINHDLNGEFSPIVFPDPSWGTNNLDIRAYPYGHEHPLVRLATMFTAWRGSLNYLITINSSMIVQGELSFIRGKYIGHGKYKWKYPQLEVDEADNNQIVNLAQERRVVKTCCFNENTSFINMVHYWQAVNATNDVTCHKSMQFPRNYIWVRPNTDITTLSSNSAYLTFKIFLEPGPDFEFLYPTFPLRMDLFRDVSVVDREFPFVGKAQLVVTQRFYTQIRNLIVDDSWNNTTNEFAPSTTLVSANVGYGWYDARKYTPNAPPVWQLINGYRYGRPTAGSDSFVVQIRTIDIPYTVVATYSFADLTVGQVIFEFGYNFGAIANVQPPYHYP